MKRKSEYYPPFKDEGEVVASWGEAQLIKYLDGKLVLKGGAKEDRLAVEAAREWFKGSGTQFQPATITVKRVDLRGPPTPFFFIAAAPVPSMIHSPEEFG